MIKLKIGDNYLITTYKDRYHSTYIKYMMSCFRLNNKVAVGLCVDNEQQLLDKYVNAIIEAKPQELYILSLTNVRVMGKNLVRTAGHALGIYKFIKQLNTLSPVPIKIKVIKIDDATVTKKYKLASKVYEALKLDKNSIVSKLPKLDDYKEFSTRYKNIPSEIKVINESIKQLSKETKVTDKITTLKDLEYLHLIESAHLEGRDLILTIYPLDLFPSEKFGDLYTEQEFRDNKYLYEATKYLYKGYNFRMVGTRISIDSRFTPRFLETLDHSFDDMFKKSNWSSVGYLHFGQGHLCGGEFNNVIAHAAEHGLEYYFLCLKQYITTANVRDYAGQKIWWYPIYDNEGKIVYCAGLHILRDRLIEKDGTLKEQLENMSWEEFLQWKKDNGINFCNYQVRNESSNTRTASQSRNGEDRFLAVVKEKEPELYEELKKGAM